jgi:hypothetical protein
MISFNLKYFLIPNTATLSVRASTYELLGDTTEGIVSGYYTNQHITSNH